MKEKIRIFFLKIVSVLCVAIIMFPATTYAASYSWSFSVPPETIEKFINQIASYLISYPWQEKIPASSDEFKVRCDECREKVATKIENTKNQYATKADDLRNNLKTKKENFQGKFNNYNR